MHKTRIIVDEKGTEAAAATSVEIGLTSIREDRFEMNVNRPFLFLIEDQETGALLFIGHVVDPS
jgi:serpin B